MDFLNYYPAAFVLVVRTVYGRSSGTGFFSGLRASFEKTFISEKRYMMFLQGVLTTILITVLSVILGTLLGKKEGIRFIGTAVYTAMQGFLAAKCGAEYVAPYVNRIDNLGFDGIRVSREIHDAITANGLDSGLLAASFKNSQQVLELIRYGVKAVTVAPDVIEGLVKNAAIDAAVDQFTEDFRKLVGEGKTMADC